MSAQVTTLWNHTEPSEADQQYDLQLLTICGVSVLGRWAGNFGEYYVGWALPLNTVRSQLLPYHIPTHVEQPNYVN
jgi:hypothetical protein